MTPEIAVSKAESTLLRLAPRLGERVGIACSGGADSTLLLELAARVFQGRSKSLHVLHANHHLRGEDSTGDAIFVAARAKALGLECHVLEASVDGTASAIEARARVARYTAFRDAAEALRLDSVLLAHHADDQIETIIQRLLRRSDARGLAGMPRARPLSDSCRIFRPFLDLPRSTLRTAAESLGVKWREDATNLDTRFQRNHIRHHVLPQMEEAVPGVKKRLLRLARIARQLDQAAKRASRKLSSDHLFALDEGTIAIRAPSLFELPRPIAYALVEGALVSMGLLDPPLERRTFDRILRLVEPPGLPGAVALPRSGIARVERGLLWFQTTGRTSPSPFPISISIPAFEAEWRPPFKTIQFKTRANQRGIRSGLERARSDPFAAILDRDRLGSSLSLRTRLSGERVRMLGAEGGRPLKRVLRDAGVPRSLRQIWPIFADEHGFLWSPGLGCAERVRVGSRTTAAIEIRAKLPLSGAPEWLARALRINRRRRSCPKS